MSSSAQPDAPVRRRRWQFSLLWLLGAVAVVAVGLWAFRSFVVRPWRDNAIRELAEAVRQCDRTGIDAAIVKINRLDAREQAAAEIAPLFEDLNWTIRSHAAHAIASLDAVAVPELIHVIERQVAAEGTEVRDLANLAAYALCVQTSGAVRRLCDVAQKHANGSVRATLIMTLSVRYPDDSPNSPLRAWEGMGFDLALPAPLHWHAAEPLVRATLLAALSDVDPSVRRAAAGAFGGVRPDDSEVWEALTRALRDEDLSVRLAAASALAAIDQGRAAFA